MPYKISGTLSDAARIIVIKESDWSIVSNTEESGESYEIDSLESAAYSILARKSGGEEQAYGNVTPEEYTPPVGDRGVFGGGNTSATSYNTIDYITITTTGDAIDFGDLVSPNYTLAANSNGSNNRGVFGGGYNANGAPISYNTLQYITISSTGNTTDFGDLTTVYYIMGAASNGTNDRGVFVCMYNGKTIEYITISSLGNSIDFGDLIVTNQGTAGLSNGVNDRGIFGGLYNSADFKTIEYITISSTGNATDFGDLTLSRGYIGACSNGTNDRGVFGGGTNVMDYITISSTGNATDFGDLTSAGDWVCGTSNGTNDRGIFAGRQSGDVNVIEYITISSTGNATDFGDLTVGRGFSGATSNA